MSKKRTYKKKKSKIMLFPILFVVSILPLILRMEIVETGLSYLPFLPDNIERRADFFLLWKSRLFVATATLMLFLLLDFFLMKRQKDTDWKAWIPLWIYELLAVFSSVFSTYRDYSFGGMMDHYETIWVLLGYGVTAYYTYIFTETREDIRFVTAAALVGAGLHGVIGLSQLLDKNILDTSFVKAFMIPEKYESFADRIVFNFSGEAYQKVSSTLYNPNYAGIYFAMMLFLALTWIFSVSSKKKVMFAILSAVLFVCLVGTGSRAAMLAFLLGLLLCIILMSDSGRRKWREGLLVLVCVAVLWAGYDNITGKHTMQRLADGFSHQSREYVMKDIAVEEDHIRIIFGDRTVLFGWEKEGEALFPRVTDEKGTPLPVISDEHDQIITIKDSYYDGLVFWCYRKEGVPYLCMEYEDMEWLFTDYTEDGALTYINMWGKPDCIEKAESVLFSGREEMFTYRGYIWGRTIPLLKNYLVLGSGPDTFLFVFPQSDYVMRSNMGFGFFSELLTKPHSMYLQMAVQTGVLSVVAFLAFVGSYIIRFIRILYNRRNISGDKRDADIGLAIGIFVSIVGYMIFGIANDSMLVTAPVFFVFLGLGMRFCALQKADRA